MALHHQDSKFVSDCVVLPLLGHNTKQDTGTQAYATLQQGQ
jgi:hypothetical protein